MNLRKLTNKALDEKVIEIAKRDRELQAEAVLYIAEVARREMYLEMGFSSIYEYLTRHAKFPNGSAQRYMDAAKVQLQVPELASKIESGQINLSQVRVIQESVRASHKQCRQEKKPRKQVEMPKLIESLEGLTVKESQVLVAQAFDLKVIEGTKIKTQKDGSVRAEMTFTKEQWADLQEALRLISHSLPCGNDLPEGMHHLAKKEIRQSQKAAKPRETTETLTPAKKKAVHDRDKCCQFKSKTGQICASMWNLQVDHIQPLWAGGSNELMNLQLHCGRHNRFKYRKEAGIVRL